MCEANEDLFHKDPEKLFFATQVAQKPLALPCQELAQTLHAMIREASPSMAERLAKADLDFMPMIAPLKEVY